MPEKDIIEITQYEFDKLEEASVLLRKELMNAGICTEWLGGMEALAGWIEYVKQRIPNPIIANPSDRTRGER